MNEVACVFRPLVEEVRARRIPPEKLLHGLPVSLEELGNPRRRISWDHFAELAERCSELLGPDAFEELAARSAEAALPRSLRWLLVRVGSVRAAYRISPFWGPRVFRATRSACEVLPDGRVRERIEILPGYRESPEFFRGVRGLLRATPRLFGEPDAKVELESDGRRGEFLIELEPPPRAFRPRGARRVSQADPVERLARALGRARGWHELPGVAVRLLQHELGVRGAALSRARPASHAPEVFAETGDRAGRPASARPLVFAGRAVGMLSLWTPGERPLGEEAEQRLHALRPLLAFLVESLQLAEANQRLTQLLEDNLRDWKRVEAALERIAGETGPEGDSLASALPPFAGTVLLIGDDELRRLRGRREIEAQGHPVVAIASDLSDLPLADPVSGPIRLVVADLENNALQPESIRRIARLHPELRGVLLLAPRRS